MKRFGVSVKIFASMPLYKFYKRKVMKNEKKDYSINNYRYDVYFYSL